MSNQKASTLTRSLDLEAGCDISFSPNVKQIELINRLHATGFWGSTPREVVRRLIDRALEEQAGKLS